MTNSKKITAAAQPSHPPPPPPQQRPPSPSLSPRAPLSQFALSPSNSFSSSSSVTTTNRIGSHSHRRSGSQPNNTAATDAVFETGAAQAKSSTQDRKRRASYTPHIHQHHRSNSTSGVKEGPRSLNRWSQSTGSSKSSASNERRGPLARRLSIGASPSPLGLGSASNSVSPPRKKVLTKPRPLNSKSKSLPRDPIPRTPTNPLPPLLPLSPLEFAPDTLPAITPLVIRTNPSTPSIDNRPQSAKALDYFGESWEASPISSSNNRRPSASPSNKALPVRPSRPSSRQSYVPSTFDRSQLSPTGSFRTSQVPRSRPISRQSHRDQLSPGTQPHHRDEGEKEREGSGRSPRRDKQQSQKVMLSKALQKANTAVLLDNAQNFEGAIEAYGDACELLQQVMMRSTGDDEKRKLLAIRNTYSERIIQLKSMVPQARTEEKALPARPGSDEIDRDVDIDDYLDPETQSITENDDEDTILETATVIGVVNDQPSYITGPREQRTLAPSQVPPRRESLLPSALITEHYSHPSSPTRQHYQHRAFSKSPMREQLHVPMEMDYMPPPLTTRRAPSPMKVDELQTGLSSPTNSSVSSQKQHSRANSTESTSWLDTIDESGGSSVASSVHSRSSSRQLRRKRLRAASGATEAEFDAALDAAVEAAWDDGFEPAMDDGFNEPDVLSTARRNVEMAKERVRQAERETAIQAAKGRERRRLQENRRSKRQSTNELEDLDYLDHEAEEEERMLEEMARDYLNMDDFEFDLQSKSALPRQSDSSGFSGRTWGSSIGSNFTTAGIGLSTVTEAPVIPAVPQRLQTRTPPPLHPPPSSALPPPPVPTSTPPPRPPPTAAPPRPPSAAAPRPPSAASTQNQQGVRSRRLSGQNPKQLKIETSAKTSPNLIGDAPLLPPPKIPAANVFTAPKSASATVAPTRQLAPGPIVLPPATAVSHGMTRWDSPQFNDPSPADSLPSALSPGLAATTPLAKSASEETDGGLVPFPRTDSPARLTGKPSTGSGNLRLAFSSSSLKNRNLSVSSPDGSDGSPGTPGNPFTSSSMRSGMRSGYQQGVPPLPTPTATSMPGNPLATYFDSDIHSPYSPGSPNPMALNAPIPLEPCPSEYLLRPYWLMRCFYQTIVHNRGGYLSTKLFVPRDVWRVQGVKIKGMDEKISCCDLLTAALLKLAKVDTDDADAVLEEMQSLENVLDQVQTALSKKLGNEVGVQGSQALFKDAGDAATGGDSLAPKSSTLASKSYLSWKRLRSKNSSAGLTNTFVNKDGPKESFSMSTLPMASAPVGRIPKRTIENVQFTGPNANYMSSLARLFDAAQVLDQIARQAEDPGLKHSSPTQVGLELSTRHASEFFGFYICRFVLTDVSMMLDKFIKRGSEWVLV